MEEQHPTATLPISPRPGSQSIPAKKPELLRDTKNQVYVRENGTMVKLGQLVVNAKGEQVLNRVTAEPANKKERKKKKAGLPYRTKS